MTPQQMKAKKNREIQFASVAQAWRCVKEGRLTLEEVASCPPDGCSEARWRAQLKHRENMEKGVDNK